MRNFCFLVFVVILFYGCKDENKLSQEISKIPIDIEVNRFDQEFANVTSESLQQLKTKYSYLFPEQYADSVWLTKVKDTLQIELTEEVNKVFNDFEAQKADLDQLYQHITYYYPKIKTPKVVTVINDVEYNYRVILTDTLLLIGLDNYLGSSHKFYQNIQRYISKGFDKEYLVSDVASAFVKKVVAPPTDRTFLAQMVYYGKELYIKDKLTPFISDAQKIGYTEEQLEWAQVNEEEVWRYFIEREVLYSTDGKLGARFLDPAPFSKFQLELIDNESPGRIGRYMGWQIVRAFAENNNLTLLQVTGIPAEELFKKSNYKPQR